MKQVYIEPTICIITQQATTNLMQGSPASNMDGVYGNSDMNYAGGSSGEGRVKSDNQWDFDWGE